MIEELFKDITCYDLLDSIIELLDYEQYIDLKKNFGISLTVEEYFFDTYLIKPSYIVHLLINRSKDNGSND